MRDLAKNDITGTLDVYGALHPIFIKNFQDTIFFLVVLIMNQKTPG